jgi:hypothetical protein
VIDVARAFESGGLEMDRRLRECGWRVRSRRFAFARTVMEPIVADGRDERGKRIFERFGEEAVTVYPSTWRCRDGPALRLLAWAKAEYLRRAQFEAVAPF